MVWRRLLTTGAILCCLAMSPPRPVPKKRSTLCKVAGMHLCTPEGKLCHNMRESLRIEVLRENAKEHSDGRIAVKLGKWCLVMTSAAMPPPDAEEALEDPVVVDEKIVHLAMQWITPWRTTWQFLCRACAPAGEPEASATRLYTKAARAPAWGLASRWFLYLNTNGLTIQKHKEYQFYSPMVFYKNKQSIAIVSFQCVWDGWPMPRWVFHVFGDITRTFHTSNNRNRNTPMFYYSRLNFIHIQILFPMHDLSIY